MEAKAEMKDYRFRASIKTGRKGDHAITVDARKIALKTAMRKREGMHYLNLDQILLEFGEDLLMDWWEELYSKLIELSRKYSMKFYDVEYQGFIYAFPIPDNCPSFRIHLRDLVPYARPLNGQRTLNSFEGVDAH